ncbi:MAG: FecR domain-containing protein [Chloroflexi bacterium]|nr:FecR domain-containing protein [Chloroflexota bacterium]
MKSHPQWRPFVLLPFLLFACRPSTPAAPPPATAPRPTERQATFIDIENDVSARTTANDPFLPVSVGESLSPGGTAQSGEDGRARLDLIPDGTVIRMGPNSLFTLDELSPEPRQPFTRLQLLAGQIWIILSGGNLETQTPYGTASVRGSMMGVSFDPDADGLVVTCLEGHCALVNQAGSVELTEGQASVVANENQPPSPPRPLSPEELHDWLEANPEAAPFAADAPPPQPPPAMTPPPFDTPPPNDAPPSSSGSSGPLTYSLTNNCPEGENWHWQFVGPVSLSFTLAPGESRSGQLPPGDYTVTDWLDSGKTHGPYYTPGGGSLDVEACPD